MGCVQDLLNLAYCPELYGVAMGMVCTKTNNAKGFSIEIGGFLCELSGLTTRKKDVALKLMRSTGSQIPTIPTNKIELAIKTFRRLQRGI